jgi:hypothetical protein
MSGRLILLVAALVLLAQPACGSGDAIGTSDAGPSNLDGGNISADAGGADAIPEVANLDQLLSELRGDRDVAMLKQSRAQGWPAPVEGGYLFVSTGGLDHLAGDYDNWVGTAMNADDDFHWLVLYREGHWL